MCVLCEKEVPLKNIPNCSYLHGLFEFGLEYGLETPHETFFTTNIWLLLWYYILLTATAVAVVAIGIEKENEENGGTLYTKCKK